MLWDRNLKFPRNFLGLRVCEQSNDEHHHRQISLQWHVYDDGRLTIISSSSWSLAVPSRRFRSSQPLNTTETPFSMKRDFRQTCTEQSQLTLRYLCSLKLIIVHRNSSSFDFETQNRVSVGSWTGKLYTRAYLRNAYEIVFVCLYITCFCS